MQKPTPQQQDGARSEIETAESAAFFERWAIYRKIIAHNYMGHDEIAEALGESLAERGGTRSILDLGCGDAEIPSRYLPDLGVVEYHGVDLAERPLEFARQNLAGLPGAAHFHQSDQADFIAASDRTFDVIVLGFALHHNPLEEKAALLANASQRLNREGDLLVYDVFSNPGEDRKRFFDRYLAWIAGNWTEMTPKEHALIDEHIRANDHPVSLAALIERGLCAGFSMAELRLSTCAGYHHLLRFRLDG